MTPQAKEIIDRIYNAAPYDGISGLTRHEAIQCAIVAVELILEATKETIDRPEYSGVVYDAQWRYILEELKNEL